MTKTSSYQRKLRKISRLIQSLTQKDKYVSSPDRRRPKRERALAKAYEHRKQCAAECPEASKFPKPLHPSERIKQVTVNADGESISREDAELILLVMRQTADAMSDAFKMWGEAATIEGHVGFHDARGSGDFFYAAAYPQNAGKKATQPMVDKLSYDEPRALEPDHISETDSSEDDDDHVLTDNN